MFPLIRTVLNRDYSTPDYDAYSGLLGARGHIPNSRVPLKGL